MRQVCGRLSVAKPFVCIAAKCVWLRRRGCDVRAFRALGMGVARLAGCDSLARKRPAKRTKARMPPECLALALRRVVASGRLVRPRPFLAHLKPCESGQRWAKVGKGGQRWVMVGKGGQRWAMVGKGGQWWAKVGKGGQGGHVPLVQETKTLAPPADRWRKFELLNDENLPSFPPRAHPTRHWDRKRCDGEEGGDHPCVRISRLHRH